MKQYELTFFFKPNSIGSILIEDEELSVNVFLDGHETEDDEMLLDRAFDKLNAMGIAPSKLQTGFYIAEG